MERNQVTSLLLITLLMALLWMQLFYEPEEKADQTQQENTMAPDRPSQESMAAAVDTTLSDSARRAQRMQERFGVFAPLAEGKDRELRIRTDKLDLVLHTRGGILQPVYLQKYRTHDSLPLPIFPPGPENEFFFEFRYQSKPIYTKDLYFQPSITEGFTLSGDAQKTVRLKAQVAPEKYIEHIYTFVGNTYDVQYQFRMAGMGRDLTESVYYLTKEVHIPKTEKVKDKMKSEVTLFYKEKADDVEQMDISDEDTVQKVVVPVSWVAWKNQFFTSAVMSDKLGEVKLISQPLPDTGHVRRLRAWMTVNFTRGKMDTTNFTLYYGPNDVHVMGRYDQELEKVVRLGWGPIRYVTLGILSIFQFLEQFTTNYGIIIFILALFIKLILTPLTYKSYLSMAKMQVVNKMPEVKELEERYKDDATKLQQKKLEFYQQTGVNMFGGCLPLLLQMPILFAMFSFFPQSIELRQQGFLWADDLSTYDSIWDFGRIPIIYQIYGDHVSLFALLMTISTLVYSIIQQRMQGSSGPAQMKYLAYVMPIVFLSILNNYSAGLSYYYFVFNLLTIGQTFIMKAFIDEEKIKNQIHEKQKQRSRKGKKKSGFQSWLEKQQKKQEQMMRERQQQQQPKQQSSKRQQPQSKRRKG